jgi:DNA-binding Lrp family transcriptional regulator
MTLQGLDDLDRYILHALQEDARHASSREIADATDVSASTVRKRITRLESEGIVTGYRASVDYGDAGYQLRMLLRCTAPIPERERLVDEALEVPGVVRVQEISTGEANVFVTAVAADADDLTRIANELAELGLTVGDEQLVRRDAEVPFAGFRSSTDGEELSRDDR